VSKYREFPERSSPYPKPTASGELFVTTCATATTVSDSSAHFFNYVRVSQSCWVKADSSNPSMNEQVSRNSVLESHQTVVAMYRKRGQDGSEILTASQQLKNHADITQGRTIRGKGASFSSPAKSKTRKEESVGVSNASALEPSASASVVQGTMMRETITVSDEESEDAHRATASTDPTGSGNRRSRLREPPSGDTPGPRREDQDANNRH